MNHQEIPNTEESGYADNSNVVEETTIIVWVLYQTMGKEFPITPESIVYTSGN